MCEAYVLAVQRENGIFSWGDNVKQKKKNQFKTIIFFSLDFFVFTLHRLERCERTKETVNKWNAKRIGL